MKWAAPVGTLQLGPRAGAVHQLARALYLARAHQDDPQGGDSPGLWSPRRQWGDEMEIPRMGMCGATVESLAWLCVQGCVC